MSRLQITHIAFATAGGESVNIEFGPKANIIHGPSDTGKSALVNALDFVLGGSKLRNFPELKPYTAILLGLKLPSEQLITLIRRKSESTVALHQGKLFALPLTEPDEILEARHDSKKRSNISRFLLEQIGLDGKKVRRNASNATHTLSFRDIARVCIVTETAMQADDAPGTTGQFINKTKERSVIRLLLSGEDDSGLVAGPTREENRIKQARLQLLSELKLVLEDQMDSANLSTNLYAERDDLNRLIERATSANGQKLVQREELSARSIQLGNELRSIKQRRAEALALEGRLGLLLEQYDSDLRRLESIQETGDLLQLLSPGICVVCGTNLAKQHTKKECDEQGLSFVAAVSAELTKTQRLKADLLETIHNIRSDIELTDNQISNMQFEKARLDGQINALDNDLEPLNEQLEQLLQQRGQIDRLIGLYEHWELVDTMLQEEQDETSSDKVETSTHLDESVAEEFSVLLRKHLKLWNYPEAESVKYDPKEMDIVTPEQKRSTHGKGVRSILHAAFAISLAEYCFDRNLPHPGFVILDSPLITYRPPDRLDGSSESQLPEGATAFFRDLETNFDGQVLVIENLSPEHSLRPDTVEIAFTKTHRSGRYGLFPSMSHGESDSSK
ncbi:hypothetical protein [Corynebacterium faecium]|uniref:hypothetical protein n=1 Tax=Corynebacterium faecium TaxID=3016001 RepID=UPI0022B5A6F4|nr:hypothetical protein [Corynebacterium faecium]